MMFASSGASAMYWINCCEKKEEEMDPIKEIFRMKNSLHLPYLPDPVYPLFFSIRIITEHIHCSKLGQCNII